MAVRSVTIVQVVRSCRAVRLIRIVIGVTVKMPNNITPSDHMSC
jgi:hypothetical protein